MIQSSYEHSMAFQALGSVPRPAGQGTWSVRRLPAVEEALSGGALTPDNLCGALRALHSAEVGPATSTCAAPTAASAKGGGLNVQLAQGMLLSALAPLLQSQVHTLLGANYRHASCCTRESRTCSPCSASAAPGTVCKATCRIRRLPHSTTRHCYMQKIVVECNNHQTLTSRSSCSVPPCCVAAHIARMAYHTPQRPVTYLQEHHSAWASGGTRKRVGKAAEGGGDAAAGGGRGPPELAGLRPRGAASAPARREGRCAPAGTPSYPNSSSTLAQNALTTFVRVRLGPSGKTSLLRSDQIYLFSPPEFVSH